MQYTKKNKLDLLIGYAASECGEEYAELLDSLDTSTVTFSNAFYRKRNRMIRKYKRRPFTLKFKKVFIRIAICIMIIMSIGLLTILAIPPLRESIFEAVIEWHDDYFTIKYEDPNKSQSEDTLPYVNDDTTADTEEAESGSTEETNAPVVTPAEKISEVRKPQNIPDGVEEEILIQNKTSVVIDYYNGDDLWCSFQQLLITDNEIHIDSEEAIVENISVDGYDVTFVQYKDENTLETVWNDGEYMYKIISHLISKDDILAIIKNVG